MMLNKEEFVNRMVQKGYTKKASRQIIDDLFETITDVLADGDGVMFKGFGTFDTKKRTARPGTNPLTGEPIQIPETTVIRFVAGSSLKRVVKAALNG